MDGNEHPGSQPKASADLTAFLLWLVHCVVVFFDHSNERRRALVAVGFDSSAEAEFGWSRALIASAISMNLLLFGVAAPISGWLIDRFGPRKVMLGSLILLITGVSGTVVMTEFWQFFLVWGVIVGTRRRRRRFGVDGTVGNRWFVARRGLALGILGSASSTGQMIFLPFFMWMITNSGWRHGFDGVDHCRDDFVAAAVSIHARRSGRGRFGALRRRRSKRNVSGGEASLRGMSSKNATITAREVVTNPTFWLLCSSFFVCGGTANGLIGTHLIPHEIEIGIPQIAAAVVGRHHGHAQHGRHDLFRLDG